MLESALKFLKGEITSYLSTFTDEEEVLSLTNLTNDKGEMIVKKLGMSLVNVEEDKITKTQTFYKKTDTDGYYKVNPDVRMNLYIMFTANFGEANYTDALKFLSYVIGFFQSKNVFDHTTSPLLPAKIEKLIVDLHTIPFEQQNHLWGYIGHKYFPSVLYKVRMIVIDENKYNDITGPIQIVNNNLKNS